MIFRLFVWLLALLTFGWLFRRLFGREPVRRDHGPARSAPQGRGRMVRDRICNTFLPESRALTTTAAGETHFFCSERCRKAFLDRT